MPQGRVYGRETSVFKVISVRPENEVEATWPGLVRQKAASPYVGLGPHGLFLDSSLLGLA